MFIYNLSSAITTALPDSMKFHLDRYISGVLNSCLTTAAFQ